MKITKYIKNKSLTIIITLVTLSLLSGCQSKRTEISSQTNKSGSESQATPEAADLTVSGEAVSQEAASNESSKKSSSDNNEPAQSNQSAAKSGAQKAHGKLHVSGGQLLDSNNNTVQLHGISTHGLAWFPEYVNKSAFQSMRDNWGVDTIRLALYTSEYNGYCNGGNKEQLKQLIRNGVQYCSELDMYVVIDWHILSDGNPNTYINESIEFFREMATAYAGCDNVIFEICNEPNGGTSWNDIKKYAETILPVIRNAGADNIVLIGTPTWSQDINLAADNPITGYDNIMYTFHFYAATHKTDLQNKLIYAVEKGLPVFVSEFGICDASGNGGVDTDSANKWVSIMNKYNISMVCWNLSNKNESSALINSSCSKKSDWSYNDLSDEGKWLVDTYNGSLSSNPASQNNTQEQSVSSNIGAETQSAPSNNDSAAYQAPSDNNSSQQTSAGNGKAEIKCSQVSTWNDGSSDYYQYEAVISNIGNGTLNGWTSTINFSSTIEMNQYWCFNCQTNGAGITLTPVDYNSNIEPGASVTVGFIVKGPSSLSITNTQIQ